MFISGSGNVGIGTTSPGSYRLKVDGGDVYISNNFFVGSFKVDDQGGHSHISNIASGGRLEFNTSGYSKNFTLYNGKVGIGTTNPKSMLDVNPLSGAHNTPTYVTIRSYGSGNTNGNQPCGLYFNCCINNDVNNYGGRKQGIIMDPLNGSSWGTNSIANMHFCLNESGPGGTTGITASGVDCTLSDSKMVIQHDGNVGIGTTSPGAPLEIYKKGHGNDEKGGAIILSRYAHGVDGVNNTNYPYRGSCIWHEYVGPLYKDSMCFASSSSANPYTLSPSMVLTNDGNVGIGTTIPKSQLHISRTYSGSTHYGLQVGRTDDWSSAEFASVYTAIIYDAIDTVNNTDAGGVWSNCGAGTMYLQYYSRGDIWMCKNGGSVKFGSSGSVVHSSDRRIKKNIVDVPDNLALQLVRDIPCRYYNYIDEKSNGSEKTIGFIAQEVKEVFPMAVLTNDKFIIPNEMRNLENISWEEIQDGSNNKYKLTCDLQNVSGIKYELIGSNDDNDKRHYEIIGNSDNTFTFEEKWNNVFCYGREVDDFHTLDKQKLFALNFSATQELDRQQQADKEKIAELENELKEMKAELDAIKQHLGI